MITTPKTWVANLGDLTLGITESPFYLSDTNRLVIKDIIMSVDGLIVASNVTRCIF
ncbi:MULTISPECIES: DUF417 family protein [unclassified Campylobacter]|uniref:DUF417 family protein n=1 Tax=unclassified Campylobacter TaxID=2593542 RepID=UPI003D34291F